MLYRLLGFLLGFGVVVGIALVVNSLRSAPPRMLSENEGRIETVEIQYTRDAATATWPTLSAFLSVLDPSVQVIAVCGTDADAAAFRSAVSTLPRRDYEISVVGKEITGWSKDRFLVAQKGRSFLVCPKQAPATMATRSNDALVAATLAKRWPDRFQVVQTELVFDSGDILCSASHAFVNGEIPAKNPSVGDWKERVRQITGRTPIVLDGSPGHHIGMFAAPLDEQTVIVGDPDLGERLWSEAATQRLGKPDFGKETTEPFRTAAADLKQAGFRVLRVPTVVMEPKVYISYTNAVFDVRDGHHIVFMPSYGVSELDQAASETYRSAGWEVRPIPVANVFRLCGTIGCLVNVLERG